MTQFKILKCHLDWMKPQYIGQANILSKIKKEAMLVYKMGYISLKARKFNTVSYCKSQYKTLNNKYWPNAK